jgi:sulfate adenylyltransferase
MCLLHRASGFFDGHQKLRHAKYTTLSSVNAMNCVAPKSRENTQELIPAYQGKLVNLVVDREEHDELGERARKLTSLQLSPRSLCDLELLSTGAFSPLDRFMGKADYTRVIGEMRLVNGALFPIPVSLPVDDTSTIRLGGEVALRSPSNDLLAIMTVAEVFEWDPAEEANLVLGTRDMRHPLVAEMASWGRTCISGPLKVLNLPKHYDFSELRKTPKEVREMLQALGKNNVVAFQTRNPIHQAHEELTKRAAAEVSGTLLIHSVVGLTKPGDVDHYTRVRGYKALVVRHYDKSRTVLSLLPLAMRMAGPREALWHAIIGRNYGANYFIIGLDHASPGRDSKARPFYGHYDAQDLLQRLGPEIGVKMIPFKEVVYLPGEDRLEKGDQVLAGAEIATLSGTQVPAEYLGNGTELPGRGNQPGSAARLSKANLAAHQKGFCVWFTGLSGAGKSTLAEILAVLLMERGRAVTLLDGDVVRTHLSKGLGFSKEDRDTNVLRIGFVASEIVRHHGAVVVAAVSPYRAARSECRHMVGDDRFVEIFVATPLDVREQRDTKGMYARARRGEIRGFSGFSDSYEEPLSPEIRLTTTDRSPEEDARQIISYLIDRGFLLQDE